MLASISPEDPEELALLVTLYWLFTFIGMVCFGQQEWLSRVECFTMIIRYFSALSPIGIEDKKIKIGLPGWKLKAEKNQSISAGLFVLTIFAVSSFDGLNETFWWLDFLDINPLEFSHFLGNNGWYYHHTHFIDLIILRLCLRRACDGRRDRAV